MYFPCLLSAPKLPHNSPVWLFIRNSLFEKSFPLLPPSAESILSLNTVLPDFYGSFISLQQRPGLFPEVKSTMLHQSEK